MQNSTNYTVWESRYRWDEQNPWVQDNPDMFLLTYQADLYASGHKIPAHMLFVKACHWQWGPILLLQIEFHLFLGITVSNLNSVYRNMDDKSVDYMVASISIYKIPQQKYLSMLTRYMQVDTISFFCSVSVYFINYYAQWKREQYRQIRAFRILAATDHTQ